MRTVALFSRLAYAGAVITGCIFTSGIANAQPNMPCSTARVIVPFAAGGESDIITRIFTDAANKAYVDRGFDKAYEGTAIALAISQPVLSNGQIFGIV